MNKNLFLSGFISISFHTLLVFVPVHSIFVKQIDIDMLKAPSSIEISLVRPALPIEVKAQKIEKLQLNKKEEKLQETKLKEEKNELDIIESKPMIGAITEQISSLLINKPPIYPTLARLKGWEGKVILIAEIDKGGQVAKIDIVSSSGFYILDKAAIKAIKVWRFRDINETTQITIPINFVLTTN